MLEDWEFQNTDRIKRLLPAISQALYAAYQDTLGALWHRLTEQLPAFLALKNKHADQHVQFELGEDGQVFPRVLTAA